MISHSIAEAGILVLIFGLGSCEREISFSDDVQPILLEHCVECHDQAGEGYAASGFSVRDYDSVMKGTKYGPMVIPGTSLSSNLYLVIAERTAPEIQMPPHHIEALAEGRRAPLAPEKVVIIRSWIDQGAKNN